MTQYFLNVPQTGALLEQVGCKCVEQRVDAAFALNAGSTADVSFISTDDIVTKVILFKCQSVRNDDE